jgi:hypothetical protein
VSAKIDAMVRFGSVGLVILAVGCAGRSIGTEEAGGAGGASAAGGTGGSVQGGSGGSSATGGSVQGGSGGSVATGGSVQGGSGGSSATGGSIATGGTVTGGSGGGSTGGGAGAGAACGLPIVSGPCNAAFFAYGFDQARGHCVRFPYGGCQGNENRFDTLAECEAACGGSNVGDCPETRPDAMVRCDPSAPPCTYGWQDFCLCAQNTPTQCSKIDLQCPAVLRDVPPPEDGECVGDDCVSRIVAPSNYLCRCGAVGVWDCSANR